MEFEVFRTGTHTDANGTQREFTEADLDFMVHSYNPKLHEAPVVIGHPKSNAPAFGWVKSLNRKGQTLFASASSLVPEFLDSLKNGLFKKRSIALNSDGTLRHIGFLGAIPPAVKGLKDIEFSDDATFFEFSQPCSFPAPQLDSPAQEEMPASSSGNLPPVTTPPVDSLPDNSQLFPLHDGGQNPGSAPISPNANSDSLSLSSPSSEFADISAREEAARKKIIANIERLHFRQRKTEFEIYLNEKLSFGSITPVMKQKLLKLLEVLSAVSFNHQEEAYIYEFSDASKEDPLLSLREFVDALPKIISYEELAVKPPVSSSEEKESFAGFSVDAQALELHEQITGLSRKENIPYAEALNKLHSQAQ